MQRNVLTPIDILQNENKTSLIESEYLNLPDVLFCNKCCRQYSINKGVYNIIDKWFYEYGIFNILSRRIYILAFLTFVKDQKNKPEHQKFVKFGSGGLALKLNEFVTCYVNRKQTGLSKIRSVR